MSEAVSAFESVEFDAFRNGYTETATAVDPAVAPDHLAITGVAGAIDGMQHDVRAAISHAGTPGVLADHIETVRDSVKAALACIDDADGLRSPRRLTAATHLHGAWAEARLQGGSTRTALGHVVMGLVQLPGSGREPLARADNPPVTAGMLLRTGQHIVALGLRRAPHPEDEIAVRRHEQRSEVHQALLNHGRKIPVS